MQTLMLALAQSRSPQGERGLKFLEEAAREPTDESFPARGAWIEILSRRAIKAILARRSPQGERGLKFDLHSRVGGALLVVPRKGSVD